jgi:hydrogenase/urease accessory protein HupE
VSARTGPARQEPRPSVWALARLALLGLLSGIFVYASCTQAHESRPAYLELKEIVPGRYDVLWRTPLWSGMRLPLEPRFSDGVRNLTEPALQELPDSLVERRLIEAQGGLAGKTITIDGLSATITDVFVRMVGADASTRTFRLTPASPSLVIEAKPDPFQAAATYLRLGIDHILVGIDHLLFVLGLMLMVRDRWMLLKTITSFTVAHSITLAIATLRYVSVPLPPLNVAIAVSILFVGPEIIRRQRGETSLMLRQPWLVAAAFGLLHGFGFASGLTALGLSRAEIPEALLLFNIGVEIGQVFFVLLIILLEQSFRTLEIRWPRLVDALPAYTVGGLGAFWAIQRTAMLIGGLQ